METVRTETAQTDTASQLEHAVVEKKEGAAPEAPVETTYTETRTEHVPAGEVQVEEKTTTAA